MLIYGLKNKKIWFSLCLFFFCNLGLKGKKGLADTELDPSRAMQGGFLGSTKIRTLKGALSLEDIYKKMANGEEIYVPSAPEGHFLASDLSPKKINSISFYRPKQVTKITFSKYQEALLTSSDQQFLLAQTEKEGSVWSKASSLNAGVILSKLDDNCLEHEMIESVETRQNLDGLVFYSIAVEDYATYLLDDQNLIAHNFNPLAWFPQEAAIHGNMVNASFLAGLSTLISLMYIKAPYGRHIKEGWGPTIPNKWGWVLMEIPSVLAFAGTYALGNQSLQTASLLLAGIWLSHYCYRTFIFPNLIRSKGKKMPLSIAMTGFAYNTFNSYLNARWISHLGSYPSNWPTDPRFILGSMVFASGLILNIHSDQILINLRKPGETGYKIPEGGGFEYVSAPNYLGELIEWTGWAIASWSMPGLSFALYTGSNLIPRALANHKWYQEKFPEYPEDRKAIIPKVL